MAKRGRKFVFHGSFSSKKGAVHKERETPGSFILPRKEHGHTRQIVVTKRKKK